jgi:hypothetical protein
MKEYKQSEYDENPNMFTDTVPNIAAKLWEEIGEILSEKKSKEYWDKTHGMNGQLPFRGNDGEPIFYLNDESPNKHLGGISLQGHLYDAFHRGNIEGQKKPVKTKNALNKRSKRGQIVLEYQSTLDHINYVMDKYEQAGWPPNYQHHVGLSSEMAENEKKAIAEEKKKEVERKEREEEKKKEDKKTKEEAEKIKTEKEEPVVLPATQEDVLHGRTDSEAIEILAIEKRTSRGTYVSVEDGKKHKGFYYLRIRDNGKVKHRTLGTKNLNEATKLYNEALKNHKGKPMSKVQPNGDEVVRRLKPSIIDTAKSKIKSLLNGFKNDKPVKPKEANMEYVVRNSDDILVIVQATAELEAKVKAFDKLGLKLDKVEQTYNPDK